MDLYDILKQIQQKGYYPLLAHPERYEYMTMKDYKALKDANVVFQLNLPALGGMYGKGVQQKAGTFLKAGAYDRIGCDIHSIDFYQDLLFANLNCRNEMIKETIIK